MTQRHGEAISVERMPSAKASLQEGAQVGRRQDRLRRAPVAVGIALVQAQEGFPERFALHDGRGGAGHAERTAEIARGRIGGIAIPGRRIAQRRIDLGLKVERTRVGASEGQRKNQESEKTQHRAGSVAESMPSLVGQARSVDPAFAGGRERASGLHHAQDLVAVAFQLLHAHAPQSVRPARSSAVHTKRHRPQRGLESGSGVRGSASASGCLLP